MERDIDEIVTGLSDGTLVGPEWDAYLVENPALAEEVALARRTREVLQIFQSAAIAVPAGFETRLMERIRNDRTFLEICDLLLAGSGQVLRELLELLLTLLPAPQPEAAT